MKKLFIPMFAVAVLAVSCKKDYACSCTYNGTTITGPTYKKVTKKWMKDTQQCVSYSETEDNVTYNVECEIEKK
jgi:hypothetical protein